jgi:hypothetical protein
VKAHLADGVILEVRGGGCITTEEETGKKDGRVPAADGAGEGHSGANTSKQTNMERKERKETDLAHRHLGLGSKDHHSGIKDLLAHQQPLGPCKTNQTTIERST